MPPEEMPVMNPSFYEPPRQPEGVPWRSDLAPQRSQAITATMIPLVVLCTRFRIYEGLWFNDFLVVGLAVYLMARYKVLSPRLARFARLSGFFAAFAIVHSLLLCSVETARTATLLNNAARIASVWFCTFAFARAYSEMTPDTALSGLRRAACVLAISVVIHSLALNGVLPLPHSLVVLDRFDEGMLTREIARGGTVRAFGMASEPYWAAAYLMWIGCLTFLASERARIRSQVLLALISLLTLAGSLVIFLPVWLVTIAARRFKPKTVLASTALGAAIVFLAFQLDAGRQLSARIQNAIAAGDSSTNVRTGASVRSVIATFLDRPLVGYGLGNADRAADAGYEYVSNPRLTSDGMENFSGIAFVEAFACLGVPGLIFFFLILLHAIRSNAAWRLQLLYAFCLLAVANAYLITHVQFFYFCLLGQVLLFQPQLDVYSYMTPAGIRGPLAGRSREQAVSVPRPAQVP